MLLMPLMPWMSWAAKGFHSKRVDGETRTLYIIRDDTKCGCIPYAANLQYVHAKACGTLTGWNSPSFYFLEFVSTAPQCDITTQLSQKCPPPESRKKFNAARNSTFLKCQIKSRRMTANGSQKPIACSLLTDPSPLFSPPSLLSLPLPVHHR